MRSLAGLVVLVGCGHRADPPPIRYSVTLQGQVAADAHFEVAGREIPLVHLPDSNVVQFQLPPEVLLADHVADARIVYGSPCKDLRFPIQNWMTADAERAARAKGGEVGGELRIDTAEVDASANVWLWVDRTGAPDAKVKVGKLELSTDHLGGKPYLVLGVDCQGGQTVTVDGSAIGDATYNGRTAGNRYFIATATGRCYQLSRIVYGQGGGGSRRELSGQRLYPIDYDIDYFLTPAPNKIQSASAAQNPTAFEDRVELLATSCR
jgi:hypothetical protein